MSKHNECLICGWPYMWGPRGPEGAHIAHAQQQADHFAKIGKELDSGEDRALGRILAKHTERLIREL